MKQLLIACLCLLASVETISSQSRGAADTTIPTVINKDTLRILNNTWVIEGSPASETGKMPNDFLPPGTRMQIKVEPDPDSLVVEQADGMRQYLEGELILLPPFPNDICRTGLGEDTLVGPNICENGKPIYPDSPASFKTQFIFNRWGRKTDTDPPENAFFKALGAKQGAQIVSISPLHKYVSWKLWLSSSESLAGMYIIDQPKIEVESQFWKKAKASTAVEDADLPDALLTSSRKSKLKSTEKSPQTFLNGTWKIVTTLARREVSYMSEEYLPPGTRLQIEVKPPTSLALEEGRDNELQGTITLLPPYDREICSTVFSQDLVNSPTACRDGEIIDATESVSFNTEFSFERWNRRSKFKLYWARGMKPGAQLVEINPVYKGATWRLWIRDQDTLIGECLLTYQSKEADILIQIWRRVKTQ
jgi:hypothetical protein